MKTPTAQDELDYLELIEEVALIDEAAAQYMHGPMREIEGFQPSGDLWEVVVWEFTKQGTDYWYNIAIQL
jgi:hypothetical protein